MLSRKMTRDASAQRLLRNRHRHVLSRSSASAFSRSYEAKFDIATLQVIDGALPPHGMRLVKEWAELHRAELAADWERAVNKLPLTPIEPLP
jgi:Xaa-Pro aminopeptidase